VGALRHRARGDRQPRGTARRRVGLNSARREVAVGALTPALAG